MSLNRVMVTGNLTRDPELRQTPNGMAVLSFGIAVNDRRKNSQTGEWEDYPNFLDCTMFGPRAEGLSRILTKGSKVAIDGKLRWSQWERDGQKRSKVEIIVDSLDFMTQRSGNQMASSQPAPAPAPVVQAAPVATDTFGAGTGDYSAPTSPAAPTAPVNPSIDEDSASYGTDIPF